MLERGDRTFVLVDTAGPAPQAPAPAGHRVLLGAARARGGGARRRRARPRSTRRRGSSTRTSRSPTSRARPTARRSSSSRSGTSRRSTLEDVRARARAGACASVRRSSRSRRSTGRGLERLLDARRRALRAARRAHPDARAEPRRSPSCARRGSRRPRGGRRLNLLYGAQIQRAPAALPVLRQRPGARHARLRLLGREPAARALRPRGRAGLDRLRRDVLTMRFLVVGAGSWGTAFTRVLLERGHEVVLGCRTAEQARGDRRDRAQPALTCRASTCAAAEAVPLADGARGRRRRRRRGAEQGVRRRRRARCRATRRC